MNNLKILFLGQEEPGTASILSPFGNVTYSTGESNYTGYDLVALNGSQYSGDFSQLFNTLWNAGISIGVLNITQDQVSVVSSITGIGPSGKAQAVLAAKNLQQNFRQVRYLVEYPQGVLDVAAKAGIQEQELINTYINAGLQAHFNSLREAENVQSGPPPTNYLIPTYSQVPFSLVKIPTKNFSLSVSMQNLGSISMSTTSQLYCYHENAGGNDDYIVIIITQLTNIPNGNPVSYTKSSFDSCSNASWTYEWDQFFGYGLSVQAQNASGQPYTGLTIYDSSPAAAKHGQSTLTDSISNFTIYMQVLNGGTWGPVNFPASYSNLINTPTVKWFDITSLNNQGAGTAGVNFNIPTNVTGGYLGDKSPQAVNFEVINIFRFPGTMVQNGSLPVKFLFSPAMSVIQNYYQSMNSAPPSKQTSTGNSTQSYTTDQYDLVVLTQNQPGSK
jgi:hypothetical protein